MNLQQLATHLRGLRGVSHKLDIQNASVAFAQQSPIRNGDDCAAIPDGSGHLLFAIEGLINEFVEAEPWFAGYCAVMVNASDIYSMGGRPVAVVDALWARSGKNAETIWAGMTDAAGKYGIPIVGGHTNTRSGGDYIAAAIVGRAGEKLLTSFDAHPGDVLIAAVDLRGEWFGPYPYWNCSTAAPGDRLRADLELLPQLAERGLCAAAKDISMGGLVGTTAMLAECSGVGASIKIDDIPLPPNTQMEKWLASFPSFGFILAVAPHAVDSVVSLFKSRDIAAAPIGSIDTSRTVWITNGAGDRAVFWNLKSEPFIGFGVHR